MVKNKTNREKNTKHIIQYNALLHKIDVIKEVWINTMEMSKEEVIISVGQIMKGSLDKGQMKQMLRKGQVWLL